MKEVGGALGGHYQSITKGIREGLLWEYGVPSLKEGNGILKN